MAKPIKWTDEMLEFAIANNEKLTRAEIARQLIERLDADPRLEARTVSRKLCSLGCKSPRTGGFEKGFTPWNKGVKGYMGANRTSFKKGQNPHNQRPIGSQRICSKDKYVIEKVAEPDVWGYKHRMLWQEHHGEIPEDCIIRFIDKDRMNITIDNLICVPQGANSVLNLHNRADTNNSDLNKAIILTETLRHEIRKLRK